ncbi:RteC domain-containing protein [Chryseobacterium sp. Ch-15]|uniref:RteC domain-containing protein n=1 Tax=Chryseobacterium muglaense TaxID=2893752 RepID=A0A9Q3V1K2_9FLAO|nr:RteC domain-containing protein [Chryseobacterium muglaense]MBD3905400.1 RteC domain-containing protein [Chryseobacterium muglaense]MCC9036875.1 RteC domain-containing protein [Chryseobacterium muglaense]MCM2555263.1 RteC domain-containing protein [Chryseobacterium muglaense]
MVTKTIFRKTAQLLENLELKINEVYDDSGNIISISETSLVIIDEFIRKLKEMISPHNFENIAEEVYFFKKLKPPFISKYIYYSSVLEIESQKPKAGSKILKKYYEAEQEKLKIFYTDNSDFYSYYTRDATYLDHKVFVRNSYDLKMKLSLGFYNFDQNFTTSHDQVISQFAAYEQLEQFLKIQIDNLSESNANKIASPLNWSGSKVGLIELTYALYQMRCFNGGNIELSEVVKFVEKSMGVDLGNFHKTVYEIRNRKQGPTKFLESVSENLAQHFINSEID